MSDHSFCLVKEVMVRENVDRTGIETFFRNFEDIQYLGYAI